MTRLSIAAQARLPKMPSAGERFLATRIQQMGLPTPEPQYHFAAPERRWAADFGFPAYRLLVEVNGASWVAGRHTRGAGYAADLERANWAQTHGWTILQFTTEQVQDDTAIETLVAWFKERREG